MRKTSSFFLIVFMSFLLSGVPLSALSTLELDGGLLYLGSTDPASAPSPITPAVGMTFQLPRRLWIFDLETSFLLSGTYYQYENDRASPSELEFRDFAVPSIIASLRAVYRLPIGQTVTLAADFGLAALLRIPIPLFPDAAGDFGRTLGYLYGRLRFLYPETGISGTFAVMENIDLKVSLRSGWPLYLIWDGEDFPFPEGLLISALIGLIWHLPQTKS